MSLSMEVAEQFLTTRDQCFMDADLEAYLDLWSDDGTMEMHAFVSQGKSQIKDTISFAWSMLQALHMETRSFAVNGNSIFNEFAIVWKNKDSGEVTLQTGMGVIEVNEDGRMCYLRDYFDADNGQRQSALQSAAVRQLLVE